jgi:subtilisin family serine protease
MTNITTSWARPLAAATAAAMAFLALGTDPAGASSSSATGSDTTGTYIVMLADPAGSVRTAAIDDSADYGVEVKGIYSHSIDGYVAEMTADERARLLQDPGVVAVLPDQTLRISGQVIPTGVQRIFATTNANVDIDGIDDNRINADVAVIDTGVTPQADLNVVASVDCSTGSCVETAASDDNGHGSHVAGTIGAIDNSVGVVGVAPGVRVHSLKVCNSLGECPTSGVLAAIDYVTAHADTIEVANLSLGGPGTVDSPLNQAIAGSTDAGVAYVVAAGNNAQDASAYAPANSPDAIAVSALSDSDGKPGKLGGQPTCRRESDDNAATFSNYGSVVDIAAPGVCVLSTWKDGTLKTMSGTSMAAPHVAGAAALLASGPRDPKDRADVDAIRARLLETGNTDWTDGSPDGIKEPLLDVSNQSLFPAPMTVLNDTLETTAGGWVVNAGRTDTATAGKFQRAVPQATRQGATALQLGTTTSGTFDLVTGAAAGRNASTGDIDGGVTSVRSGAIALPAGGKLTLSLRSYIAHLAATSSADYLRVTVVAGTQRTVVVNRKGTLGVNLAGTWTTSSLDLTPFAGQTVRILVEAADGGRDNLFEAGVDDILITQQ